MIQHVFERASRARSLSRLLIATDDERIFEEARRFGAAVRMTSPDHPSGTDRVAEAASTEPHPVVVNIQGDEPLIDPGAIDTAVLALLDDPECPMATLKKRIERASEAANPNVVKVVTDQRGRAIYFSRAPIPFHRSGNPIHFKHIGLYVYRRDFLLRYPKLPIGPLERAESLEQLRALENGYPIRVAETGYDSMGVDTPEDLQRLTLLTEDTEPKEGR
jgi:3-deoxy-manno-octulosonate cytidylyltransferase (CMP-KDO synthetase)